MNIDSKSCLRFKIHTDGQHLKIEVVAAHNFYTKIIIHVKNITLAIDYLFKTGVKK